MYTTLNISKQGMIANQNKIDLVSSNIANVGTIGYKKLDGEFQTLLTETLDRPSIPNNDKDSYFGTGSKLGTVYRSLKQGSLQFTGHPSNVAIDGDGYFRVIMSNGQYGYTRNGDFKVDSAGKLVDMGGNFLDIQFSQGLSYNNVNFANIEYSINPDGVISSVDGTVIGRINLYKPTGENGLNPIGDNLFVPKEGQIMIESGDSELVQGYLETSNVDLAEEMKDLIVKQRAYQLNGRGIRTADEMWALINNMQGR